MSRHGERMEFSRFPLVLPRPDIRRILTKNVRLLILSRALEYDAYEVHDERVIRDNRRHKGNGRDDLVEDPAVFLIEIADVNELGLLDLDLVTVNKAGFDDSEEFYLEWLHRRRQVVLGLQVKLYTFDIVDALYLDQHVHRGYTRNPARAATGEPPVIDRAHLDRYADDARERYRTEHAEDLAKREAKSLANQLREAHARASLRGVDVTPEITAIRRQLEQIQSKLGAVA